LNTLVKDVNGFERNVQKVNEIVDKVLLVNYDNFKLNGQGKLELNHKLDKNAEYVFEYGAINNFQIARFL
jgi:hypothetical protein